jgi:signal transduction histidine kinase
LQSLLQNLMRHAKATVCEVRIGVHDDELVVTIDDNGCGFDPKLVVRGLGLRSVQARVAAHGGRVMVDSSPGRGAFVSLHLPLGHIGEGNVSTDSDLSHR